MPPPSPFFSSPLMITGASWNPFAAVRSPVVPLNEKVPPGAISAPSISFATSCTLLRRPGVPPYVVVYEETTSSIPIVLAISVVRAGSATRTARFAVLRSVEKAAAAIALAVAGSSSSSPGFDVLITILPFAVTWNRASCGFRETVAERRSRYCSACRPATETSVLPPAGRLSSGAIRQRGTRQRVSPYARRRGAERAVRAFVAASARSAALTLGAVATSGRATGAARSKPARACTSGGSGGGAVELAARAALDDAHRQSTAHKPGVAAPAVDNARNLGELVLHRRVVRTDGRRDVAAEEARPQALVAPDGPEPVALGRGRRHRRPPVWRDPELRGTQGEPSTARGEGDRRPLDSRSTSRQHPDCFALRESADVDAGHRRARRQSRPGPRGREPHEGREQHEDPRQEDGPAHGNPAGGMAHPRAGAVDRRVDAHQTAYSS